MSNKPENTNGNNGGLGRFLELHSVYSDDAGAGDSDERNRMLPGVLCKGVAYTIKKIIAEGCIDKQGSGSDWIQSKGWKSRWAVLVKAKIDGYGTDIPMLQIYRDQFAFYPSTVIGLDSAIVFPQSNSEGNTASCKGHFRFEIRHVKKSDNPDMLSQQTRVFSCGTMKERDQWVYSISQALLEYEKEKAGARRSSTSPLCFSRGFLNLWKEDAVP